MFVLEGRKIIFGHFHLTLKSYSLNVLKKSYQVKNMKVGTQVSLYVCVLHRDNQGTPKGFPQYSLKSTYCHAEQSVGIGQCNGCQKNEHRPIKLSLLDEKNLLGTFNKL